MFSVDQELLKEYFPMSKVTKGLLQIYQDIFKLKFVKIEDHQCWHEDVADPSPDLSGIAPLGSFDHGPGLLVCQGHKQCRVSGADYIESYESNLPQTVFK